MTGTLCGGESFVCHPVINHFFTGLAGAFPDGALDGVARYRGLTRRLQRRVQRALRSGSDPPSFAATMISRTRLPMTWPRFSHWPRDRPVPLRAHAVCLPAARVRSTVTGQNRAKTKPFRSNANGRWLEPSAAAIIVALK